ncbi:MAG: GNAT family N-acetyltransferase [Mycobacteriaceae bacterium]|nr:GNAT family N-acetyltransferase [Mycobacteriaceae bacterium]MBV9638239.1 GNAT family N-acetyltransferase [Mycobacteriaceae bacterium]
MAVHIAVADLADTEELAAVAARTFPLACPPSSTPEDIAAFIDANLSAARFSEYLADPDRVVLTATEDGRIVGYAMLIHETIGDPDVRSAVRARHTVELSKMYVLPHSRGAGIAAALMDSAVKHADGMAAKSVWLGVNQHNLRAQRFYAKHGFTINGTRTFRVGAHIENDYVMVRAL